MVERAAKSVAALLRGSLYRGESALDVLRPVLVATLGLWFTRGDQPLQHLHIMVLAVVSISSIAGILTVLRPSLWLLRIIKFTGDVVALGPLLALSGGISSPFLWLAPLFLLSISLTLPWQAEAVCVPLLLTSLALGLLHAPGTIPTFDFIVMLVLAGGVALAANWTRQLYERERAQVGKVAEAEKEHAKTREELLRTAASLQKLETTSDIFHRVAESLLNLVPADSLSFYVADWKNDRLTPVLAHGQDAEEVLAYPFSVNEGITGAVAQTGIAEIVNSAERDPRSIRIPGTTEEPEALLAVPLTDGEEVVAVLCLYRLGGAAFQDAELDTARLFASQAEVALMNSSLLRESRRRSRLLTTLLEFGRQITSSLEIEQICETVYRKTSEVLDTDMFFIAMLEDDGRSANYFLVKNREGVRRDVHRPIKDSLIEHAVTGHAAVVVGREGILRCIDDFEGSAASQVAVVAPVFVRNTIAGAIGAQSMNPEAYDEDTVRALEIIARQTGVALQNASLFRETQEALQQLERTQEELIEAEKLRVLGEMAHTISHEFNNLLAAILGRTEMLLRQEIDEETKDQLDRIRERAMHGAELVKKMRTASLPDSHPEEKPVVLKELLEGIVREADDRADGAAWKVLSDSGDAGLALPTRVVEQVFEEIMESIWSVMPHGGTLSLSSAAAAEGVYGIRLVAARSTTASSEPLRPTAGSPQDGMGLDVRRAESLLKGVAGGLLIEQPRDGTLAFTITIPARPELLAKKSRLRILIVDDEDSVRAVMVDMVDLLGHDADGVTGGVEALTMLERGKYDVVVSDVGMPEMDGAELVSRIRQKWSDIPVILISGWGSEECEEIAAEYHAVWVLEKPVQIPVLEKTLTDITLRETQS